MSKKQTTLNSLMASGSTRESSLRRRHNSDQSTPSILGRKRKLQSPVGVQSTPQKRPRLPLSALEVTPEASIKNYLISGLGRRPRAMPSNLIWANADDIWAKMMANNELVATQQKILEKNPQFKPQMRAILLDWLIEVSEVYNLHRDTYYLAMNLFDRYLQATQSLPKEQLQLVGVSCLFIAGKMEEIYPPQINEYSYVSDGACEEREIIAKEMAILTKLKWDICPMTPNNWLTVLLQLSQISDERANPIPTSDKSEEKGILVPDVCLQEFNICAQLLDLCTLDMESLNYKPLHLAAAVVNHVLGAEEMERVSSLRQRDVEECVGWVLPFAQTLRAESPSKQGGYAEFNKQVHNVNLTLLEKAQSSRAQILVNSLTKTPTSSKKRIMPGSLMTPPSCAKKNNENRP